LGNPNAALAASVWAICKLIGKHLGKRGHVGLANVLTIRGGVYHTARFHSSVTSIQSCIASSRSLAAQP